MSRHTRVQFLSAVLGVLLASTLIWRTSDAAFTATTDNAGNSFTAGSVALTDDDGGSALFTASGLFPGDSEQGCIEVTYAGTVAPPSAVTLHAGHTNTPVAGDGLADDLDVTVELGTLGSDCTAFVLATTLASSVALDAFAGSGSPLGTGWTPDPATDAMRPFRITVVLGADTASDAQGETSTATFTWTVSS